MKHDILKYILNQPAKCLGHMALDTYRSLDENSSFSLCSLPQQRIGHVLKMQLRDSPDLLECTHTRIYLLQKKILSLRRLDCYSLYQNNIE